MLQIKVINDYDLVEMKLFYQILLKNEFDFKIINSKKHWHNLYDFIKNSNSGSKFYIHKEILCIMDRNKHYISLKSFYEKLLNLKTKKRIKVNNFPVVWNNSSIIRENDNDYNVLISNG